MGGDRGTVKRTIYIIFTRIPRGPYQFREHIPSLFGDSVFVLLPTSGRRFHRDPLIYADRNYPATGSQPIDPITELVRTFFSSFRVIVRVEPWRHCESLSGEQRRSDKRSKNVSKIVDVDWSCFYGRRQKLIGRSIDLFNKLFSRSFVYYFISITCVTEVEVNFYSFP